MRRIKVGDRVCLFSLMNKVGTVLDITSKAHDTWMVEGSLSQTIYVTVKYDDDTIVEHSYSDLLLQD